MTRRRTRKERGRESQRKKEQCAEACTAEECLLGWCCEVEECGVVAMLHGVVLHSVKQCQMMLCVVLLEDEDEAL